MCAISPAGFWAARTPEQTIGTRRLRALQVRTRVASTLPLPLVLRAPAARRLALQGVAVHGDRLSTARAVEAAQDLLNCSVVDDLLATGEELAPLDPLPCPVTLAWAGADAVVPAEVNGAVARTRLPGARLTVLPGVGHVAMVDDPGAVAQAILEATPAA